MAAVMLHAPSDAQTMEKVRTLLEKLSSDPANGIAQVLDHDALVRHGGLPNAAFLIVLNPGYYCGNATSGDLVTAIPGSRGSHGFSPEYPEMRTSFVALGPGIAHHRDLGVVDMRQTVAGLLGVSLSSAKAAPLNLKPWWKRCGSVRTLCRRCLRYHRTGGALESLSTVDTRSRRRAE